MVPMMNINKSDVTPIILDNINNCKKNYEKILYLYYFSLVNIISMLLVFHMYQIFF